MEATRFDTAMKKAGRDLKKNAKASQARTEHKSTSMDHHAPKITFVLFEEIVEISPAQSRTQVFDVEKYPEDKELYDSIKARGVITPVIVRDLEKDPAGIKKRGNRRFALVSGHRRIEAGKLAGLKGVPGILAQGEDDHELMTLAENMGRRELSTYERAVAILSLKEDRGFSIRQTADVTGLARSTVARMVSSFDAPAPLQEMWKEGSLPIATLEVMKRHWDKFDENISRETLYQVEMISKRDVEGLCAQLDLGTDIETALQSIGAAKPTNRKPENNNKKEKVPTATETKKDDKTFKSEQKEAIIKALEGVFPKTKAGQFKALFDLAIATNTKDIEVLWAAALYVSRGGKVDRALGDASTALQDRSVRSLIAREVKLMRRASSLMQDLARGDKELKRVLQTIFVGS